MSVLYKALQKAAKENEQRQATAPAGFDPERLAGSGVIRAGSSRGKWRVASLLFLLIAVVAMGAAYYFTVLAPQTQIAVAPPPRPRMPPPAPPANAPAAAASQTVPGVTPPPAPAAPPAMTQVAAAPQAAQQPAAQSGQPQASVAAPPSAAPTTAAPPAVPTAAGQTVPATSTVGTSSSPAAAKPEAPTVEAKAAEKPTLPPPKAPAKPVSTREPMPTLAVDSPARMLDPPINIHRNQIDLEGVGAAVRVRTVSQAAQDNVGSGYNALLRGQYDTALGFYEQALKQEPHSVLALLGRGTALQKLGRKDEARAAYEQVLKADPQNREALSNIISMEAERAPGEALKRLVDLERDYPNFSPIKAQIAMVYARMDDLDGALDYLRRALAISPEATLYQYNLALVLDRLNRPEEAVAAYSQVLASMNAGHALPELSAADIQRRVNYLHGK